MVIAVNAKVQYVVVLVDAIYIAHVIQTLFKHASATTKAGFHNGRGSACLNCDLHFVLFV